ncbi:hypothetical protein K503DRAFT_21433 [Rhizopogon vinicolor AM-OR11-026]|uniref:RING-type domain-containing protein n=1 Tax=Rhizopogon vinicolor AM-OR11-026 TaxID=1314800 RepID=A0A1B7N5M4_9AGAM|nr:hypothetical protein K503DRAFT_21433 [Rhizopogon vinicolor AM-OR11-026]
MDELLIDCSIHLDGVPLKDVRTFKCGHGFCKTCVETLFAGPPPFKCPTCRKRISRKDGLQIFLNPHRSPTQPGTQSARRASDIDIDLTVSDDEDSAVERVSNRRKRTREHDGMLHRLHQLQQQVLAVNEEQGVLKIDYRELQQEHAALEAQHVALKGDYTALESQHYKAQRIFIELQKKYDAAASEAQQWRESCQKARADASAARKEKETQAGKMAELADRERDFRHRAHANKLAVIRQI